METLTGGWLEQQIVDLAIFIAAIFPVIWLFLWLYRKDVIQPEPKNMLLLSLVLGGGSALLSFFISYPLEILGFFSMDGTSFSNALRKAFFGAAIPEECAKFVLLIFFLKRNSFFDERMDGIVYAAGISLGFAAFENYLYLISDPDDYWSLGLVRAFTSIPLHFFCGILMGYYYSLATFVEDNRKGYLTKGVLIPIIVHGTYDAIIFLSELPFFSAGLVYILFFGFCLLVWRLAVKRIDVHLNSDAVDFLCQDNKDKQDT